MMDSKEINFSQSHGTISLFPTSANGVWTASNLFNHLSEPLNLNVLSVVVDAWSIPMERVVTFESKVCSKTSLRNGELIWWHISISSCWINIAIIFLSAIVKVPSCHLVGQDSFAILVLGAVAAVADHSTFLTAMTTIAWNQALQTISKVSALAAVGWQMF